ncbi:MAG: hypothetical protein GEU28_08540 [Dehalococcoidia bacterium]|nr:hypothetical protein [Dehalococcoidia bacterium]
MLIIPALLVAVATACGSDSPEESPEPEETPGNGDYQYGSFDVDSVEVLFLESFPVQINVSAHGTLADGCTEIHESNVEQEGNDVDVSVSTRRPSGEACTDAIVPHSETLGLGALAPGDYVVTVNDVSQEFTVPGGEGGGVSGEGDGGSAPGDPGGNGIEEPPPPDDEGECTPPSDDPDAPVSSDDPPPCPTAPIDEEDYIFAEMTVETIDILVLESFPVQIVASATGYLGDGCTELHEVDTQISGNDITVTITTRRPADAICTLQLVGHTENVNLGAFDPGDYTVTVNDVSQDFTVP